MKSWVWREKLPSIALGLVVIACAFGFLALLEMGLSDAGFDAKTLMRLGDPILAEGESAAQMCVGCHGTKLLGQTGAMGPYGDADAFAAFLKSGPPLSHDSAAVPPPHVFPDLSDRDIRALFLYLQDPPPDSAR